MFKQPVCLFGKHAIHFPVSLVPLFLLPSSPPSHTLSLPSPSPHHSHLFSLMVLSGRLPHPPCLFCSLFFPLSSSSFLFLLVTCLCHSPPSVPPLLFPSFHCPKFPLLHSSLPAIPSCSCSSSPLSHSILSPLTSASALSLSLPFPITPLTLVPSSSPFPLPLSSSYNSL